MTEDTRSNLKKSFKPQDEHFDSFDALCDALQTRYTLGFRDACKMLKVSRSWMNNYIRPSVPVIYLSNGFGNSGLSYHWLAFKMIGIEPPPKDQVFFDKSAFESYIFSHIVSCQKRSKRISKSMLMSDDQKKSYVIDFEKKFIAEKQAEKAFLSGQISASELNETFEERVACWKAHVPESALKELQFVKQTKRTEALFVDVPFQKTSITKWMAIHDILDYGDAPETIYRDFFERGMIRVELSFDNPKNETKAKKVYYINDPDDEAVLKINDDFSEFIDNIGINQDAKNKLIISDFITVSEASWQTFNQKYNVL